ncbi:MAG: hypothetical protein KF682_09205 [Nitrospira sp.]|nr:hypothetical protein [Nitrospira sp.]
MTTSLITRLSLTLSLVYLCLLAACDQGSPEQSNSSAEAMAQTAYTTQQVAATQRQVNYESELESLNAAIESAIQLSAKQIHDGLLRLELVSLYVERARLTGNYDDYRQAESVLVDQEHRAGKSSQTSLPRASLHYTLHRLKLASAALDEAPSTADKTEVAGLRADIAFYSGRYKEAENTYRSLVNQVGISSQYIRLALLKNKMGSPGEAAAFLEAAEKRYHGVSATKKAWMKLQRGLIALDRGRFDEALAMYKLATDELPGWWLIDEHIAEIKSLTGDKEAAKTLYESVIRRTGSPEYMDALATIEFNEGNREGARKLTQQARAVYEERLARFPEAAAGHALTHFLQDAGNPQRALSLAQMNFNTRPYGDAAIALARAWLLNGQANRAVSLLQHQLSSGWDTAELYWVLGEALTNLGQQQQADQAKSEARRRNPESETMYSLKPFTL